MMAAANVVNAHFAASSSAASHQPAANASVGSSSFSRLLGEPMHFECTRVNFYHSCMLDLSAERSVHVTTRLYCSGSLCMPPLCVDVKLDHALLEGGGVKSSHKSSQNSQSAVGLRCPISVHAGICEPLSTVRMAPSFVSHHPPIHHTLLTASSSSIVHPNNTAQLSAHHHHHQYHHQPQQPQHSSRMSVPAGLLSEDVLPPPTPPALPAAVSAASMSSSSLQPVITSRDKVVISSLTSMSDNNASVASLVKFNSPPIVSKTLSSVIAQPSAAVLESQQRQRSEDREKTPVPLEAPTATNLKETVECRSFYDDNNSDSTVEEDNQPHSEKSVPTTPVPAAAVTATTTAAGDPEASLCLISEAESSQHQELDNATARDTKPPDTSVAKVDSPATDGKIPSKVIPQFYFPGVGVKPLVSSNEVELQISILAGALNKGILSESKTTLPKSALPSLMQALSLPLYWKSLVYYAAGGAEGKPINKDSVLSMWKNVLTTCNDEATRFIWLLTKGQKTLLTSSDFEILIQDILETHPGLQFLQSAKDFHSRYIMTVSARIFYSVNSSWSGQIVASELRKSDFLSVLESLETEDDINMVTQYFSYEHFYVIYCKFWELDEDHDLVINKEDLAKHGNKAISSRMIDRIFSGAVFKRKPTNSETMSYPEFVWFLLAEEDKRHPRSIEYWFRCMDLDGDGVISMYEMEYFYTEQLNKMEELGIDPIPFDDCLCQMLDMISPQTPNMVRLGDLKRCKLCHIFFDTFFNLPKYLEHEQRDPFGNLKDIEEGLNELSDWDRYASEAYEALVAEDGGQNMDDPYESDFEPDIYDQLAKSDTNSKGGGGKNSNSSEAKNLNFISGNIVGGASNTVVNTLLNSGENS